MIKISIDEAAGFDSLAIQETKVFKMENSEKRDEVLKSIEVLWNELETQIGPQKLKQVYNSKEYKALVNANEAVFDLVSLIKQGLLKEPDSAAKVDNANTARYWCKKSLQATHFSSELTEKKVEYS